MISHHLSCLSFGVFWLGMLHITCLWIAAGGPHG